MSQSAGREEDHSLSSSPIGPENKSAQVDLPLPGQNGGLLAARESVRRVNPGSFYGTPFGAIRVDASGIVLEHRLLEATEASAEMPSIVGRRIGSLAAWANEPAFVSALQSAIASSRLSFHLDFKVATPLREMLIHVNILAVGDRTAWIFISDKTLGAIIS